MPKLHKLHSHLRRSMYNVHFEMTKVLQKKKKKNKATLFINNWTNQEKSRNNQHICPEVEYDSF